MDSLEQEIILGLNMLFKGHFVALRYEDQKLLVYDDTKELIYHLSGIVSSNFTDLMAAYCHN